MMENNLNFFRLYASVRFNRPIEDTDIISPGGYEFLFREAVASLLDLKFDFDDSELWVSEEDPCMIEFMQKNPDRISFPFVDQITREHLANVAHILDFYIDTDTVDGSEPLIPVELVYASFTDDDGNRYDIRPEVIESVFKDKGRCSLCHKEREGLIKTKDGDSVCHDCFELYYHTCPVCGKTVHFEEWEPEKGMCEECSHKNYGKDEEVVVIDKIIAHLEDFSRRSPMGVVAYDGDSVVDSNYCDDENDLKEFFEEHSDEISPTALLYIQVDAEDLPLYADDLKDFSLKIKAAFESVACN